MFVVTLREIRALSILIRGHDVAPTEPFAAAAEEARAKVGQKRFARILGEIRDAARAFDGRGFAEGVTADQLAARVLEAK